MHRMQLVLLLLLAAACAPRHAAGPKDPAAAPAGVRDEARIAALHRARTGPGVGDYCLGAGDLLWWPSSTYDRKEIARRLRYIQPATSFRSA